MTFAEESIPSHQLFTRVAEAMAAAIRTSLVSRLFNFSKSPTISRLLCSKSQPNQVEDEGPPGSRFFPRRCVMYVPGDDEHKLAKSRTLSADSFVFDCEDGVAANRKDVARNTILSFLQTIKPGQASKRTEFGVRINSVESGLAEEDLKLLLSGERIPHTIYLPKVEEVDHITWFAETAGRFMQKKDKDINLVIYTESAKSLLNLKEICLKTKELEEYHIFNLDAIVFGSDDFCASIGAVRTDAATEVLTARQQIVLTAKAFNVQPIDVVYINFKDTEGLKRQCMEGAKFGFTGKQCIHPDQIPIIQEAFTPSKEQISWARELVTLYEEHQKSGQGAFVYKGAMIDKPLLLQAENLVKLATLLEQ